MTGIDPNKVDQYFSSVEPSIMGPYMMEGFGFPVSAGEFRFKEEVNIVESLLDNMSSKRTALDLGCGIGFWTETLARQFEQVEAVEASDALFSSLQNKCRPLDNVTCHKQNVMSFVPNDTIDLAFLGGLLMYLNDDDALVLLKQLADSLSDGAKILCRESTLRGETEVVKGDYSVIYRTRAHYESLFVQAGLTLEKTVRNDPYVLLQMGCETMKLWKRWVPKRLQYLSLIGHLNYYALRVSRPLIMQIPAMGALTFPRLQNHFFLLSRDN